MESYAGPNIELARQVVKSAKVTAVSWLGFGVSAATLGYSLFHGGAHLPNGMDIPAIPFGPEIPNPWNYVADAGAVALGTLSHVFKVREDGASLSKAEVMGDEPSRLAKNVFNAQNFRYLEYGIGAIGGLASLAIFLVNHDSEAAFNVLAATTGGVVATRLGEANQNIKATREARQLTARRKRVYNRY